MADIYLGRLLTLEGAEKFEDALQGKMCQIGPNVQADEIGLSTVDFKPDFEKYSTETARVVINKNMEESRAVHSYCMVGSDIEEVMNNLKVCAFQPTSEDAIENIENGNASAKDYFGGDRVSLFVIKMSEEEFRTYCDLGLIGYEEDGGKYEINGATQLLGEAIVGDKVLAQAIKEKQVILYDEVHKAFEALDIGYDNNIFDNYYKPTETIGSSAQKKSFKNSEIQNAYDEIMSRTDLSPKDKEFLLNALRGTEKAQKHPQPNGKDDDDFEMDF